MPIATFLNGEKFDRETKRVVGVAFDLARTALGLRDRADLANEIVAQRIIEFAKQGERSPELLCELALNSLRERYLQRPGGAKKPPFSQDFCNCGVTPPSCLSGDFMICSFN
jgi:hypothetical protein